MQVQFVDAVNHFLGLVMGGLVGKARDGVGTGTLDFLCQHGKVELGGVEPGQVAVLQPGGHLRQHLNELGTVHQVFVLHPVYF